MARLLTFNQSLYFGGDDAVLLELIRAWPGDDSWTVMLNAAHPGRPVYEQELAGRARVVGVDVIADGAPGAACALAAARRLSGPMMSERPDAILVSSGGFPPTSLTLAALLAARRARPKRLALVVHNYPDLGAGARRLWRSARGRLAAAVSDVVISVSRDCADRVSAACGRPLKTILNGMPARSEPGDPAALRRELGIPADAPLIGAIGDVEPRKGYRALLEAFAKLAGNDPRAHLAIIGAFSNPEEVAAARALAAAPVLGGRARLLGYMPRAWRFMPAFDVCAVPSLRFESFGLAALDAMRAGKPVVAARTGGLAEVVADGETGVIVPPGDAAALAGALAALLSDSARARRLGEAGRARAETLFSPARMAREYRQVLVGS